MRVASLGSGSRGNATLIECEDTRVLIDCGFSVSETERRLGRVGLTANQLDAVLVTHEHSDHIGGVERLARRHDIPVWMTRGTGVSFGQPAGVEINYFSCHSGFEIGTLRIDPFPVPHDAREPSQFVVSGSGHRLGVLTDTGEITRHIIECLRDCDALILEFNHDESMLADGPYPPRLKARVGGRLGHLSNGQAAGLLKAMDGERLQWIVAAHLSEKNNQRYLVEAELQAYGREYEAEVVLACQEDGFDWRELA